MLPMVPHSLLSVWRLPDRPFRGVFISWRLKRAAIAHLRKWQEDGVRDIHIEARNAPARAWAARVRTYTTFTVTDGERVHELDDWIVDRRGNAFRVGATGEVSFDRGELESGAVSAE